MCPPSVNASNVYLHTEKAKPPSGPPPGQPSEPQPETETYSPQLACMCTILVTCDDPLVASQNFSDYRSPIDTCENENEDYELKILLTKESFMLKKGDYVDDIFLTTIPLKLRKLQRGDVYLNCKEMNMTEPYPDVDNMYKRSFFYALGQNNGSGGKGKDEGDGGNSGGEDGGGDGGGDGGEDDKGGSGDTNVVVIALSVAVLVLLVGFIVIVVLYVLRRKRR